MGSGFAKKKKQARQMQEQMTQMQEQMAQAEAKGEAGNGLVTIILSGDYKMKEISVRPDCVDPEDVEGLQDLIQAAYSDAFQKLQEQTSLPGFSSLSGGFPF